MTRMGGRIAAGTLALGLGAAGLFALAAPASASFPSTSNGRIFFDASLNGNGGGTAIYSVNPDGSDVRQLTDPADGALGPDVSADGSKVVYFERSTSGYELWAMKADGTDQQQLTHDDLTNEYPSWSPDGTQIAFRQTGPGDAGDIYVMPAAGGPETRLTTAPGLDSVPEWSPDGSKIIFHTSRDDADPVNCDPCVQSVYVMNADGTDQTQLVHTDGYRDRFPNWSPDGTRIVFEQDNLDSNPPNEIYTANADGSDVTVFAPAQRSSEDADEAPDWSPDGTQISWSDSGGLYTAAVSGGTATDIVSDPSLYVLSTDWSTDPATVVTSATTVTANPGKAVYGQPVTVTASVTNHGGATAAPTGTVSFAVDGTVVASAVRLHNGRATYTSKKLDYGFDLITATYSGDAAHTSSSATLSEEVDNTPGDGTTSVADGAEIAYGTPVTAHFTARAPSTAPIPNGTYGSVTVNGTSYTGLAVKNGTVTVPTADLPAGSDSVQVCLNNVPGFYSSICTDTVTVTVDQIATTTRLASSANPAAPRQKITLTATLNPAAATGSVTFFADGSPIGTGTVVKGRARLTTKFGSSGTYQITASYSGDTGYAPSDSNEIDQQVQ